MLHCIVSNCTWIARIGTERFLLKNSITPHQGKIGINSCSTIIHYHHYSPRPLRPIQDIQENPVYIFMLNFFPHSPPPLKKKLSKVPQLRSEKLRKPCIHFQVQVQSNSFKERQTWHFKDCGRSCPIKAIIMRQEKNGILGFVLQRVSLESCTGPDTNTSEGFSTFSWNIEKGAKVSWPDHFQTWHKSYYDFFYFSC